MPEEIAPILLPQAKVFKRDPARVFNWRGYFAGMWVSSVRAATGAALAFSGTQSAEAIAPVVMNHVGMTWKQAVAAAISALIFDVIRYINLKPVPDLKEDSSPPVSL
jgi:hypothetical protein